MKRAKYICATFYLFALLAFTGCASLVQVKAEKSGMQTLSAEIDLGEVITNAIKEASSGLSEINSSGGLDSNNELVIFDTKKIKSALENSEFKNAKISSPEFSKLNISGTGNLSFAQSFSAGLPSESFISRFVISGLLSSTSSVLLLFSKLHYAQ